MPDLRDTCPDLAEPEQRDLDGDGLGDACDDDDDADGNGGEDDDDDNEDDNNDDG